MRTTYAILAVVFAILSGSQAHAVRYADQERTGVPPTVRRKRVRVTGVFWLFYDVMTSLFVILALVG